MDYADLAPPPNGGTVFEGDNLDSMAIMAEANLNGKISCVLTDPPYETGNRDMIYADRRGRSDWLDWLLPRLISAWNLLDETGAMFICIDDANRSHLDVAMSELLPNARIGSIVWKTRSTGSGRKAPLFSCDHEHVLIYGKPNFSFRGIPRNDDGYKSQDLDGGRWRRGDLTKAHTFLQRPGTFGHVLDPVTGLSYPCNPWRVWAYALSPEGTRKKGNSLPEMVADGCVLFPKKGKSALWTTREELDAAIDAGDVPRDGKGNPLIVRQLAKPGDELVGHGALSAEEATSFNERYLDSCLGIRFGWGRPAMKHFSSSRKSKFSAVSSLAAAPGRGNGGFESGLTAEGTRVLSSLIGGRKFDYPKPLSLFQSILRQAMKDDGIVLDPFAGSGTTGHATLALNEEDGGSRAFILCGTTEDTGNGRNVCRDVCANRLLKLMPEELLTYKVIESQPGKKNEDRP